MQPISKEYLILFSAVSEAQKTLMSVYKRLMSAQQLAEEAFLSAGEIPADHSDGGLHIVV